MYMLRVRSIYPTTLEQVVMENNEYGNLTLSDLGMTDDTATAPIPPSDSEAAKNMADDGTEDPTAKLDQMDLQSIIDYLVGKKVLPEDFEMPKDVEVTPPPAAGGFGDINMDDLMGGKSEDAALPQLITGAF